MKDRLTFYASIVLDKSSDPALGPEVLNFSVEAEDMLQATRFIGLYLKGRFEGSGIGGDISHIGRTKVRGVEYRGL